MERQNEYVLRTVEERGVRFVRLWFTDVLGLLNSVEITPDELEVALEKGMTFDGSTIAGWRSKMDCPSRLRDARRTAGSRNPTCWPSPTPTRSSSCPGAIPTLR